MKALLEIGQYLNIQQQKSFKALGANLNFIDIWLKLILDHYDSRCDAYINAMKEILKQIPQTMSQSLTPKQKVRKLMTDIGGGWYMEKSAKGLPLLKRSKPRKSTREAG